MNISDIMRQYMKMLEDAMTDTPAETPAIGDDAAAAPKRQRVERDDIRFEDVTPDKVVAYLAAHASGRYTKLAQQWQELATLTAELKDKQETFKSDFRELVADLFAADDCIKTRVVETASFTIEMTKDPKASTTYKYAKVVEELEKKLNPELKAVMSALLQKYQGSTQKAPAVSMTAKVESFTPLREGPMDVMKSFYAKFKDVIFGWAKKYDQQLENLKRSVGDL
jgi:hypothetical protein